MAGTCMTYVFTNLERILFGSIITMVKKSFLEFFSTEPLDVLIKKRSSFIVNKQQHKAPGKWWDGLYSVYDMKYGKLRGPEDTDGFNGWWEYVWGCDDPILSKAPFVAAKNVVYPDSTEIASLEYYLKNFVWGKLQRADQETPYPFAIYRGTQLACSP